jgi:hypothetical protein
MNFKQIEDCLNQLIKSRRQKIIDKHLKKYEGGSMVPSKEEIMLCSRELLSDKYIEMLNQQLITAHNHFMPDKIQL